MRGKTMDRNYRLVPAIVPAILMLAFAGAAHGEVRLSTGVEYTSGSYGGTEDIEDLYVPVTLSMSGNRISASVTVPYLSVRAPLGTTLGPYGEPLPGSGEITTESGLGDVTASLTLFDAFYSPDLAFAIDLTGAVKFGTADVDKGLGTGEQDFTIRADLYKFFEQFTLLTSLGYKLRGDPAGIDLDDEPFAWGHPVEGAPGLARIPLTEAVLDGATVSFQAVVVAHPPARASSWMSPRGIRRRLSRLEEQTRQAGGVGSQGRAHAKLCFPARHPCQDEVGDVGLAK